MKRILYFLTLVLSLCQASSCSKQVHDSIDSGSMDNTLLPEPPEKSDPSAVFHIGYFSEFTENCDLLTVNSQSDILDHISEIKSGSPVLYFLDGVSFESGVTNPVPYISRVLERNVYFTQYGPTSDQMSGAVVVPVVEEELYDGIVAGDSFISGCRMNLSIPSSQKVTIYTCLLDNLDDFRILCCQGKKIMEDDAVVIGRVPDSLVKSMEEEYEKEARAFRLSFYPTGKQMQLYVITAADYVCRKVGPVGSELPLWRISIEKF